MLEWSLYVRSCVAERTSGSQVGISLTRLRANVHAREAGRIVFHCLVSIVVVGVFFLKLTEVEAKFPFANSILAFSCSQDPWRTFHHSADCFPYGTIRTRYLPRAIAAVQANAESFWPARKTCVLIRRFAERNCCFLETRALLRFVRRMMANASRLCKTLASAKRRRSTPRTITSKDGKAAFGRLFFKHGGRKCLASPKWFRLTVRECVTGHFGVANWLPVQGICNFRSSSMHCLKNMKAPPS